MMTLGEIPLVLKTQSFFPVTLPSQHTDCPVSVPDQPAEMFSCSGKLSKCDIGNIGYQF